MRGEFSSYAAEFATKMVAAGFGYSIIRLGHEMNGNWETDSVGTTKCSGSSGDSALLRR